MAATDTNRVWFITGASSGFGLELAAAVLARGDRAVITARRADALRQLEHEHPDTALAVPADSPIRPPGRRL